MSDLFKSETSVTAEGYTAKDIEVLEGLEPVRRRPGMYIGGTDERAFHHLVAEILDNAMDEAVAGHASVIDLEVHPNNKIVIKDNGRGIPIDPHPKHPDKSALEVIFTTLHSGGKFGGDAYKTSGGLHGVGVSVVNALSQNLVVEVAREKTLWRQTYSRGHATSTLEKVGNAPNRRGTTVTFEPDPEIFGERLRFKPATLYRMARSKAYLFRGVRIRWACDPALLKDDDKIPASGELCFPNGLTDFLNDVLKDRSVIIPDAFSGKANLADDMGAVEWAVSWCDDGDGFFNSYCNTIPTPEGGTHEAGLRTALTKGLKSYADLTATKKGSIITAEDVLGGACIMLSVFIRDPQFQGQTKEKLVSTQATRLVDQAIKDHFDLWLTSAPEPANALLAAIIERADERLKRKQSKELSRKSATKRLRLPGKLADCTRQTAQGCEIFLVEGDSAGGSAKQARRRDTQAVLPLRGKILNVASASLDKMLANQEIRDLSEALGCGIGKNMDLDKLRYERVIIMTDADVDGAHIASLLMTFFFQQMPDLVEKGHLFLAMPPLYRITQGAKSMYARDDAHKDELLETEFNGRGKIEISRFKGLGEMPAMQLKETTMNPESRQLMRVKVPPRSRTEEDQEAYKETTDLVEQLMGKKPEARYRFIQDNASFINELDL
jgi:topoisomerase-4 subunit B